MSSVQTNASLDETQKKIEIENSKRGPLPKAVQDWDDPRREGGKPLQLSKFQKSAISLHPIGCVSEIKLIRTDTTL